jgi:hypothetical protein
MMGIKVVEIMVVGIMVGLETMGIKVKRAIIVGTTMVGIIMGMLAGIMLGMMVGMITLGVIMGSTMMVTTVIIRKMVGTFGYNGVADYSKTMLVGDW